MISESLGAVWAVESMCRPFQQFIYDILVHRGCLRCRSYASPVAEVSLMISESLGLFALSKQCGTRDSSSLMIYESLGAVWAVESMREP